MDKSKPKPKKVNPNKANGNSMAPRWRIELPLDHPCQIYPRVSTPEQMKNVSAEMQKDKSFAILCGWRNDQIILDESDLGISGQELMEDREAFRKMLRRISNGEIKAVVVVNVDRLFRDRWGAESGKFMEICYTYGVLVVTPDFVYDFSDSYHVDMFKRRCGEAYNFLENQIYGRLHVARDRHSAAGFWSGGNMPMGYVIDTRQKIEGGWNPNYHRYVLYEPHAEIIRWIFRRFRELNGNVALLLSEIKKKRCLFSDFNETVDPLFAEAAYKHYTKVTGGYTISSDHGLRYLLSNRIYIGCWVYQKKVIKLSVENYPPAIVDVDIFTYAYNRLSDIKLDGTPNEDAVEGRGKQYAKKHFAERPAILKGVIFAADSDFRVYTRDEKTAKGTHSYYYISPLRNNKKTETTTIICTIMASGIDRVVLERMRRHMQRPETEAAFQNFTDSKDEVATEIRETLKDIDRDTAAIKKVIANTLEQIKSGKFVHPDLAQAANDGYVAAKEELERLEERKASTTKIAGEGKERKTYKELMQKVENLWDNQKIIKPEDHPRLVYLFVKSVTLDLISPSFFIITIEWKDPAWGTDKGLCYKGEVVNSRWTDDEEAILLQHWTSATRKELLELLPRRSYSAMLSYMRDYKRTTGLEIRRPSSHYLEVPRSISLYDWKVMQKHGIAEADIRERGNVKLVEWYLPSAQIGVSYDRRQAISFLTEILERQNGAS